MGHAVLVHHRQVRARGENGNALRGLAGEDAQHASCGFGAMLPVAHHIAAEQSLADAVGPQMVDRCRRMADDQLQRLGKILAHSVPVAERRQQQHRIVLAKALQPRCEFLPAHGLERQHFALRVAGALRYAFETVEVVAAAPTAVADHQQALEPGLQLPGHGEGLGNRDVLDDAGNAG